MNDGIILTSTSHTSIHVYINAIYATKYKHVSGLEFAVVFQKGVVYVIYYYQLPQ